MRRALSTPWRPASPNASPTSRHRPGCSPSWSANAPDPSVLDDSRLRRRRRPRQRARKPRHDHPLGRGRRRRRRRRDAWHGRRDQPEGAAGVGRGRVQRSRGGDDTRRRRRRRTAADRHVVASGHGAHRGRLERADRHRRRQRGQRGSTRTSIVDEWVRIEHRGRAESLNVAMATTVLCFEALRHRRCRRSTDGAVIEPPSDRIRPAAPLEWLALAVALAPFVVAVVRAAVTDWMPVGDAAYFTVRSADVLTAHHPLRRGVVVGFGGRRRLGEQPRAAATRRARPVHQGLALSRHGDRFGVDQRGERRPWCGWRLGGCFGRRSSWR